MYFKVVTQKRFGSYHGNCCCLDGRAIFPIIVMLRATDVKMAMDISQESRSYEPFCRRSARIRMLLCARTLHNLAFFCD